MAIYLDNNATTALTTQVLRKQTKALFEIYGNPSDPYRIGVIAKREMEKARLKLADLIGANMSSNIRDRIVFTSCATEANNAVFNSATKLNPRKKHIIVSSVEHLSVLEVARDLEKSGYKVSFVPVNQDGKLDLDYLSESINNETLLVSIMMANNETGVIFPIDEIVKIVRNFSPDILIHTDAVQAIGKLPINVSQIGIDFLSLSGHKFHAPKGVGALYIKTGVPFKPFFLGGHQEGLERAGTENTASIIAMGEAAVVAKASAINQEPIRLMRDAMEQALLELPMRKHLMGAKSNRLSNTTNISFPIIDGYELMLKLAEKEIYVSTGSACNSESEEPSHVIKAMGIPTEFQKSIRVSLSNTTTQEEIDTFLTVIRTILLERKGFNHDCTD